MTDHTSDRELLEETWQLYDVEFAEYVGEIVTPDEYLETDEQVDWAARIFMFAYALGSVAGARTADPDAVTGGTDLERVERIVDEVVAIHDSDEFEVSNERVHEDFLGE